VQPVVAIVMGSSSDHEVMAGAAAILERFQIDHEIHVVSAHRTPEAMIATTTLPVIGVPVALARLDGLDSLLSIAQMPRGVPVATVAINGATNAGLLALRILAVEDAELSAALETYRLELAEQAGTQDRELPRS